MTNETCLWCDAPSEGSLCGPCRAVNDHLPFYCANPRHAVPTLGPSCARCDDEKAREAARTAHNAPIVAQLRQIRADLIRDWHNSWPGAEHGKALVGHMIDGALEDLK